MWVPEDCPWALSDVALLLLAALVFASYAQRTHCRICRNAERDKPFAPSYTVASTVPKPLLFHGPGSGRPSYSSMYHMAFALVLLLLSSYPRPPLDACRIWAPAHLIPPSPHPHGGPKTQVHVCLSAWHSASPEPTAMPHMLNGSRGIVQDAVDSSIQKRHSKCQDPCLPWAMGLACDGN